MKKEKKHKEWGWIRIKESTIKKLKRLKLNMDMLTYDEVLKELIFVYKQK